MNSIQWKELAYCCLSSGLLFAKVATAKILCLQEFLASIVVWCNKREMITIYSAPRSLNMNSPEERERGHSFGFSLPLSLHVCRLNHLTNWLSWTGQDSTEQDRQTGDWKPNNNWQLIRREKEMTTTATRMVRQPQNLVAGRPWQLQFWAHHFILVILFITPTNKLAQVDTYTPNKVRRDCLLSKMKEERQNLFIYLSQCVALFTLAHLAKWRRQMKKKLSASLKK